MTTTPDLNTGSALPTAVEFLASVEAKAISSAHRRLLKAARSLDPLVAMSVELGKLASGITDET